MAQLILNKDNQYLSVTSQLNMFYRLVGFIVLVGSLFILFYPELTGEKILYRGQLDLQLFTIPGLFLSFFAFMARIVKVDLYSGKITVTYGIPLITVYKKIYALSFFYKVLLSVDNKPPKWSASGTTYEHVKPWYHVSIISNKTRLGTEVVIAKSTNSEESGNIAKVFSEYTKIPLEVGLHYPT